VLPTHSHKPVSDEFLFRTLRFDLLGASRLLDAIARSPGPQLTSEIRLFLKFGEPRQALFKQQIWKKIEGSIWRFTADNDEAVLVGSR
jgi:hypothetical protein